MDVTVKVDIPAEYTDQPLLALQCSSDHLPGRGPRDGMIHSIKKEEEDDHDGWIEEPLCSRDARSDPLDMRHHGDDDDRIQQEDTEVSGRTEDNQWATGRGGTESDVDGSERGGEGAHAQVGKCEIAGDFSDDDGIKQEDAENTRRVEDVQWITYGSLGEGAESDVVVSDDSSDGGAPAQLEGGGAEGDNHSSLSIYRCRVCEKDFDFLAQKTEHEKEHLSEKPFRCRRCPKAYMKADRLLAHELIHDGSSPHTCGVCDKMFTTSRNLDSHMLLHSGEKTHICRYCGKAFRMHHHLQLHENVHNGIKPYQCKTCSKSFVSTSCLRAHETVHSDARPYLCDVCGASFKRPHLLKRHLAVHSKDRPFKCAYCDKTFTRAFHMRNHEKIHTGVGLVNCSYCDKSFYNLDNKVRHERIHLGHKPYQCTFCEKTFIQESQQRSHEKWHLNRKTYTCTVCWLELRTSRSLDKHMRTHGTSERGEASPRYNCSYCDKSFVRAYRKRAHEKLHTGEGVFICRYCDKRFGAKDNWKRHETAVHADEEVDDDGDPSDSGTTSDKSELEIEEVPPPKQDGKLKCDICFAEFKQSRVLYRHKKVHEADGNR